MALFVSFLGLYFLPYNIGHFKVLGPLFLGGAIYFIYQRGNYSTLFKLDYETFLVASTIFFSFATFNYSFIGSSFIVVTFFLLKPRIVSIKPMILNWLALLTSVSCFLQLLYFQSEGRPVLFVKDPNFSGMYLLILFFFFTRVKNLWGQLFCLVCSTFILSRAFTYSLIIYYFIFGLQKLSKRKIPFFFLMTFLIANTVLLIASYVLFSEELRNEAYLPSGIMRLIPRFDSSVQHRFDIIRFYINYLIENPDRLFLGIQNYLDVFNKENTKEGVLHNSFLSLVARFGIVATLPYFLILRETFMRAYHFYDNEERIWFVSMFLSWCFFSLFLQGLLETYLIMGLFSISFIKKSDNLRDI